ncbi:hypothetical protein [Paracoccus saliphilus]|nr:hypothetical protein [Paracoccus saliphilus]
MKHRLFGTKRPAHRQPQKDNGLKGLCATRDITFQFHEEKTMKRLTQLSLSIALAAITAASFSHAQEMKPDDMMQGHGMMGDEGMSGMMGMMQMMDRMGPMMEACTEMMQAMNDKADAEKPTQQDG